MNYIEVLKYALSGTEKLDRIGIGTVVRTGVLFRHDMAEGFPLVTQRRIPFKPIRVELEGFLKGITDKSWYQARGCKIWDEWANPQVVAYGHSSQTKEAMRDNKDLGAIYGYQWRRFGLEYTDGAPYGEDEQHLSLGGVDQIKQALKDLREMPDSRRILITAWNPSQKHQMSIPSCCFNIQFTVVGGRLNLLWSQRSSDVILGLPFDIASHALLLHLFARELNLEEGELVGFLADAHVYKNHIEGAKQLLSLEPYPFPEIISKHKSFWEWDHTQTRTQGYKYRSKMSFKIAI